MARLQTDPRRKQDKPPTSVLLQLSSLVGGRAKLFVATPFGYNPGMSMPDDSTNDHSANAGGSWRRLFAQRIGFLIFLFSMPLEVFRFCFGEGWIIVWCGYLSLFFQPPNSDCFERAGFLSIAVVSTFTFLTPFIDFKQFRVWPGALRGMAIVNLVSVVFAALFVLHLAWNGGARWGMGIIPFLGGPSAVAVANAWDYLRK